jgi:hypothetical protein
MATRSAVEPLPGQAQPPYILVFDMDGTILGAMPGSFWAEVRDAGELTDRQLSQMRSALINPIVDILIRAAELRGAREHRVDRIFLLTNNASIAVIKALDKILLEEANRRLYPPLKPLQPYPMNSEYEPPTIVDPVFFDAILIRQDPQRRPVGAINPTKSIMDVDTLLLHSAKDMTVEEMLPRVIFFDDIPNHEFKLQIPHSQYIVVKKEPGELEKELGKLPMEFWQPLGTQGGGRRRVPRQRRSTRRRSRVRRSRSRRTRATKVYARRH